MLNGPGATRSHFFDLCIDVCDLCIDSKSAEIGQLNVLVLVELPNEQPSLPSARTRTCLAHPAPAAVGKRGRLKLQSRHHRL